MFLWFQVAVQGTQISQDPRPCPQATWPSDIHIVSNGIPNYVYSPWALVVTWDTDISTDPSCSRTTAPDMAMGSNPGPGPHHVLTKSLPFSTVYKPCVFSLPSLHHVLHLSHISSTHSSIIAVPAAGTWVSFFTLLWVFIVNL